MFFKNFILKSVLLSFFVCFTAYGQNKKTMKNRPIAQLYKNAEKLDYASMPQYYIEGYQSGCYYELYVNGCLLYTSPSPRDQRGSRMPSSA